MTSSILSPFSNQLSGADLRVLKDFAIEAPWAWQQVLGALIETAEDADELTKASAEAVEKAEAFKYLLESMVETLESELQALREATKSQAFKGVVEGIDSFEKTLTEKIDEVRKALKETE